MLGRRAFFKASDLFALLGGLLSACNQRPPPGGYRGNPRDPYGGEGVIADRRKENRSPPRMAPYSCAADNSDHGAHRRLCWRPGSLSR